MTRIIHVTLAKKSQKVQFDVVQGATLPEIVFVLDDYTPIEGATAKVYTKTLSGAVSGVPCQIDGHQITYQPNFEEVGRNKCQLRIDEDGDILYSYVMQVDVSENIPRRANE